VSRSTRIKVSIPEDFTTTSIVEQEQYLFKYLKDIGFSKRNFAHPIEIDEHEEALWEYFIEQLPEIQEEIEIDKLIGAYYLIHRVKNSVLSYQRLCEIIIELRGGLSVYYFKRQVVRSEAMSFRDNLSDWIETVLEEPEEDLDIEVRRAEYRRYASAVDRLAKQANKQTTLYVTLTRPSSPIRKALASVEKRLTKIQNEQTTAE
jgi:hypothetical protein